MCHPLVLAFGAVWLAGVPAAEAASYHSFRGWCETAGVSRYDQPMTGQSRDNGFHSFARGSCWGELNGVGGAENREWAVETGADGPFHGSCYESRSTAPAPGFVRFTMGTAEQADDVVIRFTMTFRSDPVYGSLFELRGETSGEMRGQASFGTLETTPRAVLQCETGGLSESSFTAGSYTVTPLVGPASEPPLPPPPPPVAPSAKLRGSSLPRAFEDGLRVRCRAQGPATCRLVASVSRRDARRHGLSRRRIGSARADVPHGDTVVDMFIGVRPRARRRLRRAQSLVVTISGVVVRDGSDQAVGDRRRLRR